MADYNEIKGNKVQYLTSDPTLTSANEGQVWYNSTTGVLKSVVGIEAWSSGANLTQSQRDGGYGASTPSTASWFAGGVSDPTRNLTTTQEWNGSGWSNGGNLNVGREEAIGFGLVNAAALAGGSNYPPSTMKNEVEEYDGSSWTAVTALPAKRRLACGTGTQTTGLVGFGKLDPPATSGAATATSLEYNGSSWTAGGTGNTARSALAGAGTQTASLAFGGQLEPNPTPGATEQYDGSSWTTVATMNNGRGNFAGNGTQTSALAYAGFTPYSNKTESWDGTSWTNSSNLATAKDRVMGGGTDSSNAIAAGGLTSGGVLSTTEEFNRSINVITAGAWASGGNMSTGRITAGDCGTYLAGLVFGGNPGDAPYADNATEEYDGSAWTAGGNVPQSTSDLSGAGTQTAALCFAFSSSPTATTATYDGSSWTTVPATLPTTQGGARGIGTQTAALVCGFGTPTFEYDGSSWTAGGALNNNRTAQKSGGWGIQTAAIIASGYYSPPATLLSNTETYDGTSWTETGHSVVTAVKRTAGTTAGTSSNGMLMGGSDTPGNAFSTVVQKYNGTSWVTQPSLATTRFNHMGFGTATNAVVASGQSPSVTTATEEFTGETSAITASTITSS